MQLNTKKHQNLISLAYRVYIFEVNSPNNTKLRIKLSLGTFSRLSRFYMTISIIGLFLLFCAYIGCDQIIKKPGIKFLLQTNIIGSVK